MTILADFEIKELCESDSPMITPFHPNQVKTQTYKEYGDDDGERSIRKVISYGLSSYGYDIRLNDKDLKVFTNVNSLVIDPRAFDKRVYSKLEVHYDGKDGAAFVILPPNTGMLGHTVEKFNIPKDVITNCLTKSTYARCFISVIVTPLEPEWEGVLTLEIINHSPLPARVYLNQGIAQLMFYRGNPCNITYKDRQGKYLNQVGTVDPRV